MIVSAHQPAFLPWLGFWHKVSLVEKFVLLAGVKFKPEDYANRCKVDGRWITLPVVNRSSSLKIKDAKIDRSALKPTAEKLASHFGHEAYPFHQRVLTLSHIVANHHNDSLLALNFKLLCAVRDMLGLKAEFAIDCTERTEGTTTTRLYDAIAPHHPHLYVSGMGGVNYLNMEEMPGVRVVFQDASGFADGSILSLLACHANPLQLIANIPPVF